MSLNRLKEKYLSDSDTKVAFVADCGKAGLKDRHASPGKLYRETHQRISNNTTSHSSSALLTPLSGLAAYSH